MSFLYRYVFRGIGWVLLYALATVLWIGCGKVDAGKEAKAKADSVKAMKQITGNGSEAMREYAKRTAKK
jgi:hypothetical protein